MRFGKRPRRTAGNRSENSASAPKLGSNVLSGRASIGHGGGMRFEKRESSLTDSASGGSRLKCCNELLDWWVSLGRVPTHADFRLHARREKGFPSTDTLRRTGPQRVLVETLLGYCRAREEHPAVVKICEEYLSRPLDRPASETEVAEQEIGYVYLLKAGRSYKIGKTIDIGRREYELAIQLPERAQRVHAIRTDDPSGIEAYWHRRFESKRKNGEWFELAPPDVAAFRRRKFM